MARMQAPGFPSRRFGDGESTPRVTSNRPRRTTLGRMTFVSHHIPPGGFHGSRKPEDGMGHVRLLQPRHLLGSERDRQGSHRVLQVLRPRRADDRRRDGGPAEQPGQGDLRPGHAPGARHLADSVDDRPVGLLRPGVELLSELVRSSAARCCPSPPRAGPAARGPAGSRGSRRCPRPRRGPASPAPPRDRAGCSGSASRRTASSRGGRPGRGPCRTARRTSTRRRGSGPCRPSPRHGAPRASPRSASRRPSGGSGTGRRSRCPVAGGSRRSPQDRLPRQAASVRALPRREEDLGRDHHLVPPGEVADGPAEDLLARAVGVGVRGVEEVDPQLERPGNERPALHPRPVSTGGRPAPGRRSSCTRGKAGTP